MTKPAVFLESERGEDDMAVGFEFQAPTLKIYKISDKQEKALTALQAKADWAGLKSAAEQATAKPQFFGKTVVLSKSAMGWTAVPAGDHVEFVVTRVPIEAGGATALHGAAERLGGLHLRNRDARCEAAIRAEAGSGRMAHRPQDHGLQGAPGR